MSNTIIDQRIYEDEIIWWCRSASANGYIAEFPFVEGFFIVKFNHFTSGWTQACSQVTHGPFETVSGAAAAISILGSAA